jgi:hypothetical protein
MVAGHLQEKKNLYYIVLDYTDEAGKRKQKWLPTGLPVRGNKKKAEAMLVDARVNFEVPCSTPKEGETLFADYLMDWLEIAKPTIALTTYASYAGMTNGVIAPYFRERNITLQGLKPQDIQRFYTEQLKRVKASSVIHYHAVIHRALKYAVKIDVLAANPADKVERQKKSRSRRAFTTAGRWNGFLKPAGGRIWKSRYYLARSTGCAEARWWACGGRRWTSRRTR